MASRKLVRDFLFTKQPIFRQLLSTQLEGPPRLRLVHPNSFTATRQLNVFKQFSEKLKGEASNSEFQKNVKELKEKAGGVSEELKVRTKQTAEQLYKSVDGVWTEAEATAKKVSANVKEKLSAAKEEVKGSFGAGKQEPSSSSSSSGDSVESSAGAQDGSGAASGEGNQQAGAGSETIFDKFKYGFSAATPKVSSAYEKVKEAKVVDLAKKVLDAVKDELSGKPVKRKRVHHTDPSTVETSNRTEIVIVPSKQPAWRKKWEEYKEKMQNHPMFKRVTKISEPVVSKGQELAEDLQERWETSDSPMVHKIQDLNEKVFGESAAALSFKEIRRRDPSFSLPDFVAEVQEVIKPVLLAFNKGDSEVLKKYCSPEMVERYKAEQKAYASQGVFFDNKILHISEANVTETKMMGDTPLILLLFQTQEVYCVRDRLGAITEGGKDTIHSVHYIWAMQQVEEGELGEDEGIYSTWRLRDMQRLGVQAYI